MKIGSKLHSLEQSVVGDAKKLAGKVASGVKTGTRVAKQTAGELEGKALTLINDLRGANDAKQVFKAGPVLGKLDVRSSGQAPTVLRFQAKAPGADFGRSGQESTAVSIFVDGKYQSTQAILAERAGSDGFGAYQVNLGDLPAGTHKVEIRSANWLAGSKAQQAVVRKPGSGELAGLQAEATRYAPLLVTRRNAVYAEGPRTDLRPGLTHTDAPVLMRADVTGDPKGYHLLTYRVTLTDEDSGTPDGQRLQTYGRTTDDEWCYRVLLDGNGNKVTPEKLASLQQKPDAAFDAFADSLSSLMHQPRADALGWMGGAEMVQYGNDKLIATRHQPRGFDGTYAGDRPVIRVNSGNNNFAAVKAGEAIDTPIWSPDVLVDQGRVEKDKQGRALRTGHLSDKDVIARFPWIGTLTRKEVTREDGSYPA